MHDYPSLQSFGQALTEEVISKEGKTLLGELHKLVHGNLETIVVTTSPVGSGRDKHPGLLKKSWTSAPPAESIQAGSESVLANSAPHMTIINRGRLMGRVSRKKPGTRMLGSLQAPAGITKPAFKKLNSLREKLLAEAIQKANK